MNQISDFFLDPYQDKATYVILLEAIVFISGILSVWFAKKESIWVYPDRFGRDRDHRILAVQRPAFGRYDDEFILFHHECLRLVELGKNARP